ncbi:MAG: NADH-quinone oxidoreductase subunit NuoK [Planctomycetota bacterium]|nr:NADH-quinone oxidoreductase subunit NuoK [Planctomycetota bacterium]MDA1139779.1 NADH-quinone oxidoreductase subunit NuoK [Planctomycetota bacterium]
MDPKAYLTVAAILFVLGVEGFLLRRNMIIILMSVELMLNAVNLTLVTFARMNLDMDAHVVAFFAMALAAAESSVGLAIVIAVFRLKRTANVDDMSIMKG